MGSDKIVLTALDALVHKLRGYIHEELGGGVDDGDALRRLEACLLDCRDVFSLVSTEKERPTSQLLELLNDADSLLDQASTFLPFSQFIDRVERIIKKISNFAADMRSVQDVPQSDNKIKYAVSSVSSSIGTVAAKFTSPACQELWAGSRLCDLMKELSWSVAHVGALIHKVEKLPEIKERRVVDWMLSLKDALYDVEDLLDELEYKKMEAKCEKIQGGGSFLTSAIKFTARVFDLEDDDDDAMVVKIRQIQMTVHKINDHLKQFLGSIDSCDLAGEQQKQIEMQERLQKSLQQTSSKCVFGQKEESNRLRQLLLGTSNGSDFGDCDDVSVLAIVGVGGMGKTTLAQQVFNYPKVRDFFPLRLWLTVSQDFDVKNLTKQVLESIPEENQSMKITNLNRLQCILKEKLVSKRFLIVLDDIWNEDESKWETFSAPFMFGLRGSKILATTRSRKVAITMGAIDPIFLQGVSDEDCWGLFKMYAFGSKNSETYPNLEGIGRKIAKRLKGSPLAAKTLGMLLNSKLDEEHWKTVMAKEIWELKQGKNDILPVLELSYWHLPSHLKQCFLYCSVFPKDHIFFKENLVQIWVAEGFVIAQGNTRIEDVGGRYFDDLVHKCFFEEHQGGYTMHDLLHDLARSISRDECFRIEDAKSQSMIPNTVHHLSVQDANIELSDFIYLSKSKKLRTLRLSGKFAPHLGCALDGLKWESIGIRVLDLRGSHMKELPRSIGNLIHLRYLDVSHTLVQSLPESLCNLYNLQVLKLETSSTVDFPKGITKLSNLRQLIADNYSISQIAGIGKLTALQELSNFTIVNRKGHMIEELKYMNALRRTLCVSNLENIDSFDDASQAKLQNKRHLCKLHLEWASNKHTVRGIQERHVNVLEGLQPHPGLRELEINSYGGTNPPSWLTAESQRNLESIQLVSCIMLNQLPSFGQFPFLKVLKLKSLHELKELDPDFYGSVDGKSFTLLEHLEFKDMPEWIVWSSAQSRHLFPALSQLHIEDCPKLIRVPSLSCASQLSSIKRISVINCGGLISIENLFRLPSLEKLTILKCPQLKLPNEGEGRERSSSLRFLCLDAPFLMLFPGSEVRSIQELEIHGSPLVTWLAHEGQIWLRGLVSLEKLSFKHCANLQSLPLNLSTISTLKSLEIENCPELKSLQDSGLPETLSSFHLQNRPALKVSCRKESLSSFPLQ